MEKKYSGTQQIVGTAVLVALIIVLQTIGSGIHFGPFTPTLSLVPIIIGAVLFGPVTGLGLGFVFSAIVLFSFSITAIFNFHRRHHQDHGNSLVPLARR